MQQPVITITLDEQGRMGVQMHGPAAGNKVMVIGLLELAKGAVVNQPVEPISPLVVARGGIPNGRG